MKTIKTILHPTDFSEHSKEAFELACGLARDQKARIIVLHVVPLSVTYTGAGDSAAIDGTERMEQERKRYEEEMKQKLMELQPTDRGISIERRLKQGDIAKVVLQTALDSSCDLIVMGTHGRSRYFQLLMGSVAEGVIRNAPCPVVTVKMPAPAEARAVKPVAETALLQ